jgi:hypothetical protein
MTQADKNQMIVKRIKNSATFLTTEELKNFYSVCPDNISNLILDELETRMPESEFIAWCNAW